MPYSISILALVGLMGCKDNLKIEIVRKPLEQLETVPQIIPEVSSAVEILDAGSGIITTETVSGAVAHEMRILDTICSEELYQLGRQNESEFSLPIEVYYQSVCLETTYFDAGNKVIKRKLQPVKITGPEPLLIKVPYNNQVLSFREIDGALHYDYVVVDQDGKVVRLEKNSTINHIDFQNDLQIADYKMLILIKKSDKKNDYAININLRVIPALEVKDTVSSFLSFNLRFEREYYQTRAIKRLLVPQSLLNGNEQLEVNDISFDAVKIGYYNGAFAALMSADDATMRGILPYNQTSTIISILGLEENATQVKVTLQDFNLFSLFTSSYDDNSYVKDDLEAWLTPYHVTSIKSGEHQLASSFGLMILQ